MLEGTRAGGRGVSMFCMLYSVDYLTTHSGENWAKAHGGGEGKDTSYVLTTVYSAIVVGQHEDTMIIFYYRTATPNWLHSVLVCLLPTRNMAFCCSQSTDHGNLSALHLSDSFDHGVRYARKHFVFKTTFTCLPCGRLVCFIFPNKPMVLLSYLCLGITPRLSLPKQIYIYMYVVKFDSVLLKIWNLVGVENWAK